MGEHCVDCFCKCDLRIRKLDAVFFENEVEINCDTAGDFECSPKSCRLSEKEFKTEDEKEHPVVEGHCHSTGKFRGLEHKKISSKAHEEYAFLYQIFCIALKVVIAFQTLIM